MTTSKIKTYYRQTYRDISSTHSTFLSTPSESQMQVYCHLIRIGSLQNLTGKRNHTRSIWWQGKYEDLFRLKESGKYFGSLNTCLFIRFCLYLPSLTFAISDFDSFCGMSRHRPQCLNLQHDTSNFCQNNIEVGPWTCVMFQTVLYMLHAWEHLQYK